jgi:GT2 family glycosyltransferase
MKPKVAIVVLNWNGYHYTKACVESLERITWPNYEILIVDNGSTDGSAQKLREDFPRHQVLANPANLGFARGHNVGIRRALAGGADYVLLLSNDFVVAPGFLEPAVALAQSDAKIGMIGGKIYLLEKPGCLWYAGGRVSRLRGMAKVYGAHEKDRGQHDRVRRISFVSGAKMLIKRAVLENVGLLPEEYFFGIEEWDYSVAVRRAGYTLYYVPGFVSHHKVGGSYDQARPKYLYGWWRGRLIFQEKYCPIGFAAWKWGCLLGHLVLGRWRLSGLSRATLAASHFALREALRDHARATSRSFSEADMDACERRYYHTVPKDPIPEPADLARETG